MHLAVRRALRSPLGAGEGLPSLRAGDDFPSLLPRADGEAQGDAAGAEEPAGALVSGLGGAAAGLWLAAVTPLSATAPPSAEPARGGAAEAAPALLAAPPDTAARLTSLRQLGAPSKERGEHTLREAGPARAAAAPERAPLPLPGARSGGGAPAPTETHPHVALRHRLDGLLERSSRVLAAADVRQAGDAASAARHEAKRGVGGNAP